MTSPIVAINHISISVADLDAASADYTVLLDTSPHRYLSHDGVDTAEFSTRNVTVRLVASEQPRGLEALCFEVDSLARLQRRLGRVGIASQETVLAMDKPSPDEIVLTAARETTRGIHLAFRERPKEKPATSELLAEGLDHIVIASENAEGTAFLLGSQLGLDMRMDMSRPEWKARLMFFRCGDLIVEVFKQLGDGEATPSPAISGAAESRPDVFYGLTWRVEDADASHRRLSDAGFKVSEVRKGRKPGSRVLTVRSNTANVATLLIELPKS